MNHYTEIANKAKSIKKTFLDSLKELADEYLAQHEVKAGDHLLVHYVVESSSETLKLEFIVVGCECKFDKESNPIVSYWVQPLPEKTKPTPYTWPQLLKTSMINNGNGPDWLRFYIREIQKEKYLELSNHQLLETAKKLINARYSQNQYYEHTPTDESD